MKYMNHLRKLALLSSLALSFTVAVYADGTLPLPLTMADPKTDLQLSVTSVGDIPRTPFVENGIQACNTTDQIFDATGTVTVGATEYTVLGVCQPGLDSKKRTIVTIDDQASRFTLLDGTADNPKSFSTFSGTLSHKFLVPISSGPAEDEISAALKPFKFNLVRRAQ